MTMIKSLLRPRHLRRPARRDNSNTPTKPIKHSTMSPPSRYPSTHRVRGLILTLALATITLSVVTGFQPRQLVPHSLPLRHPPSSPPSLLTLSAMKRNKFNKQKDLAAKMAEAKRQRELADAGAVAAAAAIGAKAPDSTTKKLSELSDDEIKLQNDQQRFADMLENSMSRLGEFEGGNYLTVEQEEENADAVYRGVHRLYEGDPAHTHPFYDLLDIHTDQPLGESGVSRIVPWKRSSSSNDYVVVITDPRPKSLELRNAIKKLCNQGGGIGKDVLQRSVVINADTPAENRRFIKKTFGTAEGGGSTGIASRGMRDGLTILCDENMEWMREYTALGETRFSMNMFVLADGRVQKIARDVDADVICMVVRNAIRALD